MAKIKRLIENDLEIFPITHESAVLDNNGRSLNSKYSTIGHRHDASEIDGLSSSGSVEIVDNLTSTETNKALSANQGKVLKNEVDVLSTTAVKSRDYVGGSDNNLDDNILDRLDGIDAELTKKSNIGHRHNVSDIEGLSGSSDIENNMRMKLLTEYIHTGNKEIYFTNIDYATGLATTTAPHGITQQTQIMIVPNDWSLTNPQNNLMSVPIEYTTVKDKITVTPINENTLSIKKQDGATTINVNLEDISNTNIDCTKFHFEVPIGWSIRNIPTNPLCYRIQSIGYIKAGSQYRYTIHKYNTDNGVMDMPYIKLLGIPVIPNAESTHCVFSSQVWDVYANTSICRVEPRNIHSGRRKGYERVVWDSVFESTPIEMYGSFVPKGLVELTTYNNNYAYMSNNTVIRIYDLGGR